MNLKTLLRLSMSYLVSPRSFFFINIASELKTTTVNFIISHYFKYPVTL